MLPISNKFDLSELSEKHRARVCHCKVTCTHGVTLTTNSDGVLMCWNDARRHLYKLIQILEDDEAKKYTTWTKEDEQYIIDLIQKQGGMRSGTNRKIAEALGKTYEKTKSKTTRMKKAGLI